MGTGRRESYGTSTYAQQAASRKAAIKHGIKSKNSVAISQALQAPPFPSFDINEALDDCGNSALHIAVVQNDLCFVLYLLCKGACQFKSNAAGVRPVDMASNFLRAVFDIFANAKSPFPAEHSELFDKIKQLTLERKFKSYLPEIALGKAILNANTQLFNNLLSKVEFNSSSTSMGLLHWASLYGNFELCTHLLSKNFDANSISYHGITPLIAASYNGHERIVDLLCKHGADVNIGLSMNPSNASKNLIIKPVTALMIASWKGHSRIAHILICNGAKLTENANSESANDWWKKPFLVEKREFFMIKELITSINPKAISFNQLDNEVSDLLALKVSFKIEESSEFIFKRISAGPCYFIDSYSNVDLENQMQLFVGMHEQSELFSKIQQLLKFPRFGTVLTCSLLNLRYKLIFLFITLIDGNKTKLASFSASIDSIVDDIISLDLSSFSNNLFASALQSIIKISIPALKDALQQFQLWLKLSTGVWPPENCKTEVSQRGLQLVKQMELIVLSLNSLGLYESGDLLLRQESVKTARRLSQAKASIMDYHAYKKMEEMKRVENIVKIQESAEAGNEGDQKQLEILDEMEREFHGKIDCHMHDFIKSVQLLKSMFDSQQKKEFIPSCAQIVSKIEMLLVEVYESEVFEVNQESSLMINGRCVRKMLKKAGEEMKRKCEELVLKGTLASGVFPPENAAGNMMLTLQEIVSMTKTFIESTRAITKWIKEKMKNERLSQLEWKRKCLKSENIQALFSKIEGPVEEDSKLQQSEEEKEEGILFETRNNQIIIKGGKLGKLLERIAHPTYSNLEFNSAFILTHQSFMTSKDLLTFLIKRYHQTPPKNLDEKAFNEYVKSTLIPIRMRVYNAFKIWIDNHFEHFYTPDVLKMIKEFIESSLLIDFPNFGSALLKSIYSKIDGIEGRKSVLTLNFPAPIIPAELPSSLSPSDFFSLDVREVARQLCLIEFKVYSKIAARELLNQSWTKKNRQELSPNITALINQTNRMSSWIAASILFKEDNDRLFLLKFYISLMQQCFDLHNFNSLTLIVAGLTMGPIKRLASLWKALLDKHPESHASFDNLAAFVSPKGQYAAYRKHLKSNAVSPPCIPFLGVFLTDLVFMEDGNPDYLSDSSFINFEKRRMIASVIRDIQLYQNTPFNFQPVPQIYQFLSTISTTVSEDAMYEKSTEIEPRKE